jgi:di/tricarboxylate transporter
VTIAALYVLAGAATLTGALSPVIDRVLDGRRPRADGPPPMSESMLDRPEIDDNQRSRLVRLSGVTAGMSAFIPNTPLVALAAPRIVTWCRRNGRSASLLLMPLSFASVLGGVITVIGTSTNLVISDLLVDAGGEPLGVFEMTPVGLPVAIVGVGVLMLTAPVILRTRRSPTAAASTSAHRYTIALVVDADGPLAGATIEEAGMRHLHGVFLAGVERGGHLVTARPETRLGAGDTCYFAGDVSDIVDLTEMRGLTIAEQRHIEEAGERTDAGLYEVVVSERSELAGRTLSEVGFRARHDAAVLAIRRHDDDLPGKLGAVRLRAGDVLLVLATPEFDRQWRGHGDFSVIAALDAPAPPRGSNAWLVLVAIAVMIGLAVSNVVDLMESAVLAAAALVLLRVISVTEARRSVNLNVVFTIAMSISLGTAVATSGLATEIGSWLSEVGDPFGDSGKVVAVLVATMILTELLTNNAAAAVMLPVATVTALESGLDPRAMALVVLIGASCSFLFPIGYQTNLIVYGLGGYRFTDFTRLGLPLTIATIIVTPLALPLAIPLR